MHLTLAVANQAVAENLEADLEVERDLAVAVENPAAANLEVALDLEAAAENLEADLYLVAAVENPQVLIKEMEKVIVLDRDLDHHPQAESL